MHKLAKRYLYAENVENFHACTKCYDTHSVWLYVSYTVNNFLLIITFCKILKFENDRKRVCSSFSAVERLHT